MAATLSQSPSVNESKDGFVPIPSGVLRYLDASEQDVFYWNELTDRYVLFRDASLALSRERVDKLSEGTGFVLFVRSDEYDDFCGHLLNSLEVLIADSTVSPSQRYQVLQMATSIEVERSLRKVTPDNYVALSYRLGGQIRHLLEGNSMLPRELFAIARHDSYTFSHVTNVTAYAVMLAEQMGISDQAELDEIAVGAMLHDIGKRFIPNNILTKPGSLTSDERKIIQTHPQAGYQDLYGRKDVSHAQLMMVYQHHERIDGKGYPVCITGDEMHFWARILAVVDVFDALTGDRPYRTPMTKGQAVNFLKDHKGTHFDEEVTACWIAALTLM